MKFIMGGQLNSCTLQGTVKILSLNFRGRLTLEMLLGPHAIWLPKGLVRLAQGMHDFYSVSLNNCSLVHDRVVRCHSALFGVCELVRMPIRDVIKPHLLYG